MITAGIDVGNQTVKAVILGDGHILGKSLVYAGFETRAAAERALEEALEKAGKKKSEIDRIVATGAGRAEVPSANGLATELSCMARGINYYFPTVRTVIDIGAEESRAARCDGAGTLLDFAKNDKCAAGVGIFVESMAKALEVKVEDMGELSLKSDREIPVNITCVVFAESEVISLIHSGVPKHDIARAIHDAIAARTSSMVRRIGVEKEVALAGGVARNVGVVVSLRRNLGLENLLIPEDPQIVVGLGAALIAQQNGDRRLQRHD